MKQQASSPVGAKRILGILADWELHASNFK
jgi:hypothetical protein